MRNLKDALLADIKIKLKDSWLKEEKTDIRKIVSAMPETNAVQGAAKFQKLKQLETVAESKFEVFWPNVVASIEQEYDLLFDIAERSILTRHPWLEYETPAAGHTSLKDIFLRKTLEHLLIDLLEDKPSKSATWENIVITEATRFRWQAINPQSLANQIEGYPLSEESNNPKSPKFYDDRSLPTNLVDPFTLAPTRYDLYRLIKKNYAASFKSKVLKNGVISTAMAPLHHSELQHLSQEEWNNFDTILLNVGEELNPEWVLLDKKKGNWTIYAPTFLEGKCRNIPQLSDAQFSEVRHLSHPHDSEINDWHGILLSRVLPWSQIPDAKKGPLDTYRATYPIPLLVQNAFEASCLPAQKKNELASQKAFAKRSPLSLIDASTLYAAELNNTPIETGYLFDKRKIPDTAAATVISYLDTGTIQYDPRLNKFSISDPDQFVEAMKLAYFQHAKTLELLLPFNDAWKPWFNYNLDLTLIESMPGPEYSYAYACAARNRFLTRTNFFNRANTLEEKQSAWEKIGAYVFQLFKNPNPNLDQIKNFAEMGKEGLDSFFNYINTIQKPALNCVLDLDSGKTLEASEYIHALANKIHACKKRPLFSQLDLILPENLTAETQISLLALITELNDRGELSEVNFHNPKNIHSAFISQLKVLATTTNLNLQIKIPEWDDTVAETSQKSSLKAEYRELQNVILGNIRTKRQPELDANTLSIHRPLPVRHLQHSAVAVEDDSWHADVFYTLVSGGVGIQQQAQQEVAQEVQQEAEQQTQPKATEREIGLFTGEEDALITRMNIEEHGASTDDFSGWVGSHSDAQFVIKGMDEAAYNRIRAFPSLFKFGIDWKNTPGFRLNYLSEQDKTLILTFDAAELAKDMEDQKAEPFAVKTHYSKQAIPFSGDYRQLQALGFPGADPEITVWHHTANEELAHAIKEWLRTQGFAPDTSESMQYRDVHKKTKAAADQSTVIKMIKDWSREKLSRIEPSRHADYESFLTALFDDFNSQNLQAFGQLFYHYDATGSMNWLHLAYQIYQKFPNHFYLYKQHLLDPLTDWSESLEKKEVEAFTSSMQKLEHHPGHKNIIWSLVDTHAKNVIASQNDQLTPMHYAEVWTAYNRVIDYIDANNLNINEEEFLRATLKYQGKTAARAFLDRTHTAIKDKNEFLKTIPEDPSPFNASQFLRRIYEVLQHVGNKADSIQIQQEILNNLSAIDWHENGFYYACVHENYPYWDESLKLSSLQRLDSATNPSYKVNWDDESLVITEEMGFTLRYAAQRLKLPKPEFDKFKAILLQIIEQHPNNNAALLRLISTSIALGLDTVDTLQNLQQDTWAQLARPESQAIIQVINQNLFLDSKELLSHSYHVRMADLPILIEALTEVGVNRLPTLDLTIINALGRALQSFTGDKKTQIKDLIQYGIRHGFDHPLITAFPWLVNNPIDNPPTDEQHLKFYAQLSSIQFADSTLPNQQTLTLLLSTMDTAEARHAAVSQLIDEGCFIADQDADFRLLKPAEKNLVEDLYLSKTFGAQNRVLLRKLFDQLAIKEEGNLNEKINILLKLFSSLDKKTYYDELGQVLGLLVEKSRPNHIYSLEQLTTWINTVFNEDAFKTRPYPVPYLDALITDALKDEHSSLINKNLQKLSTTETQLEPLQGILEHINVSNFSDTIKQTLVKTAIQFKYEGQLEQIISRFEALFQQSLSAPVSTAICTYINQQLKQYPDHLLHNLGMLEKLSLPCRIQNDVLKLVWEENQIKLLEGLTKEKLPEKTVNLLVNTDNELIRMILIAALKEKDEEMLIKMVSTQLIAVKPAELQKLASYYLSDPKPTLTQLNALLNTKKPVVEMINHFEKVVQAQGKRIYSLTEKDTVDLKRVLEGFKLKGKRKLSLGEQSGLLNILYYINTYSQALKLEDKTNEELLDLIQNNKTQDTEEAKARVLACMREMVLRKTGKWVNHTQMLDLVYATLHNDENLLHQLRTGEGKSIITLMRVAYRALNGQVVDVFSSKESLSVRDHLEFSPVYDAFGIRHSHITDKSNPEDYNNSVDGQGIGAVHYATIGNFSLFLSGLSWEGKGQIDTHAENRVAYMDEGDHIMRFENTLFNFSDQTEAASVYNYDAWVYKVTYDFYLENKDLLEKQDFNVYEKPDLQSLYEKLQAASLAIAPDKSNFFQKYLASGNEKLRNEKLMKVLTAAHMAQGLEEGKDYCVMNDQKKVSETATLDTRFAKVMINNQVYHGSTYSELVQQFLHVRLNEKARQDGERPNFFIEPESEIALSLNARFVLKHYYKHLEACTGTPGDEQALAFYRNEFGIDTVIKLPTHEEVKTTFLPPIYTDDEESQIQAILASIAATPTQPILITCEDDKAVERLGNLIKKALGVERGVVIDTNAQGLSEEEIVKDAGNMGAITISSRMGRGTDIKPFDKDLGLKVIRTYATTPEVAKQEQGRQGRNAAGGVCQDIVNYGPIKEKVAEYSQEQRFRELLAWERTHLEEKLNKHLGDNNEKWRIIRENNALQEQYLNTRTLQRYKRELQEASMQRMRDRDDLIAEGSAAVIEHLYGLSPAEEERFKETWKACKTTIETGWVNDPDGQQSRAILDEFYRSHKILPPEPTRKLNPHQDFQYQRGNDQVPIENMIVFHQQWLIGMGEYLKQLGHPPDANLVQALYGDNGEDLDQLYQAFHRLNAEQIGVLSHLTNSYPACHGISCAAWVAAIDLLATDEDIADSYVPRVHDFFARNPGIAKNAGSVKDFSKLFLAAVSGAPDIEFIQDIVLDVFPVKQHAPLLDKVNQWPRGVVDLCKNCMTQEDIVFLLKNINSTPAREAACIEYLAQHAKALKAEPYMIRPLIGLLTQKTPQNVPVDTLVYNPKTASILEFFNQRPGYTSKDYKDMQAKVDRIAKEEDQAQFLKWLTGIPPYIPARAVWKDLIDLPGKYSFDNGGVDIERRIHRMQSAATAFNDFLFDRGFIQSKDFYAAPTNEDEYKNWCGVFLDFPTLEKREQFFNTVNKLNFLDIGTLRRLAEVYSEDTGNDVTLRAEINKLLTFKKVDVQALELDKGSVSNEENHVGNRTRKNSFF